MGAPSLAEILPNPPTDFVAVSEGLTYSSANVMPDVICRKTIRRNSITNRRGLALRARRGILKFDAPAESMAFQANRSILTLSGRLTYKPPLPLTLPSRCQSPGD